MKRRTILTSVASAAALVLAGHRTFAVAGPDRQQRLIGPRFADFNPDRMWPVYRRFHLLIVGQRDDESGGALAAATVDVLMRFLRTRAPCWSALRMLGASASHRDGSAGRRDHAGRHAEALFLAKPPFDDIHDAPLRISSRLGATSSSAARISWPGTPICCADTLRTRGHVSHGRRCARWRRPGASGIARLFRRRRDAE